MARISIYETDETAPTVSNEIRDVVFVIGLPGMVAVDTTSLQLKADLTSEVEWVDANVAHPVGYYALIDKHGSEEDKSTWTFTTYETRNAGDVPTKCDPQLAIVDLSSDIKRVSLYAVKPDCPEDPTYCQSIDDFEYYFGGIPFSFTESVLYSDIKGSGETDKFSAKSYSATTNFCEKGNSEPSYVYAKELIRNGVPVVYKAVSLSVANSEGAGKQYSIPTPNDVYSYLLSKNDGSSTPDYVEQLKDKGEYSIKYFTTGGYPVFEFANNTVATYFKNIVESRGDCIFLLDHTNYRERDLRTSAATSVYSVINSEDSINALSSAYVSMFTPWATYNTVTAKTMNMPASFGYLMSLAKSIKTNANWLAVAGVTRGLVPNIVSLNTSKTLTNAIADSYQPERGATSINAITNIRPYGLTIWGNRTLLNNSNGMIATSYLNIRNLVNDVKNNAYVAAKKYMFEHNSDILWANFRNEITPLLEQMTTGYGLSRYTVEKIATQAKATIVAKITLYPVYAVENFDIYVSIRDEDVTVE